MISAEFQLLDEQAATLANLEANIAQGVADIAAGRVRELDMDEIKESRGSYMRYWLMKSEPAVVGIDHVLAMPDRTVDWWGVRNYQARNFMRDQMKVGDKVFFYHSNCKQPGIAGLAEVAKLAYPDRTQFDPASHYFDPKSTPENPRWVNVDVHIVKKTRLVGLDELRQHAELAHMRVLQRGNRLSITPVDPAEWQFIVTQLMKETA